MAPDLDSRLQNGMGSQVESFRSRRKTDLKLAPLEPGLAACRPTERELPIRNPGRTGAVGRGRWEEPSRDGQRGKEHDSSQPSARFRNFSPRNAPSDLETRMMVGAEYFAVAGRLGRLPTADQPSTRDTTARERPSAVRKDSEAAATRESRFDEPWVR